MAYVGNTPTQQAFTAAIDYFSGNGSTVAFTLSRPVASVAQVQVTVNNVAQNPSDAFTVSGNTITFTGAPSSGTNNIYVQYTSPITQVVQPGQGTVGTAQLQDGAVITQDIANSAVTTAKIADSNVTTAKISDSNVTTAKIADSAITSAKIADGTIVTGDIADSAITNAKLAADAVSLAKLGYGGMFLTQFAARTSSQTLAGDSGWVDSLDMNFTVGKQCNALFLYSSASSYESGPVQGFARLVLDGTVIGYNSCVAKQSTANSAGSGTVFWDKQNVTAGAHNIKVQLRNTQGGSSWITPYYSADGSTANMLGALFYA